MRVLLFLACHVLLATSRVIQEDDDEADTAVLPPQPVPRASMRVIFRDDFSHVDKNKWVLDSSASLGFFSMHTPDAKGCYTRGGTIFLRPTLTADRFGEDFLHNGDMDFKKIYGYCTPTWSNGCHRTAKQEGILPVIISPLLRSKFAFRYGKLEMVAKMPKGDWLWPALWLLARNSPYGGWPMSGEIDVAEAMGNTNLGEMGVQRQSSSIHFGNSPQNKKHLSEHRTLHGTTWGDAFHKYTVDRTQAHINIYYDDKLVLSMPTPSDGLHHHYHLAGNNIWGGSHNAPFDQTFYIIMSIGSGGGIFPDWVRNYPHAKPWSQNESKRSATEKFWRHKNDWYSTWHGEDAALQVRSVVAYAYN